MYDSGINSTTETDRLHNEVIQLRGRTRCALKTERSDLPAPNPKKSETTAITTCSQVSALCQ